MKKSNIYTKYYIVLFLILMQFPFHNHILFAQQASLNSIIENALKSTPPVEQGEFKESHLVELVKLDGKIKLDIRYATSNNFVGIPLYTQARAFLQKPAAEALVRINKRLNTKGFGLLIHDAYRPWYITKIFWDVTPTESKQFVADPQKGSRHNRGCAVDLTLYELSTGNTIEMPSEYDEMSERAYPTYEGGEVHKREFRDLLKLEMEKDGFKVYPYEWWHFDFVGWENYRIQNVRFEDL